MTVVNLTIDGTLPPSDRNNSTVITAFSEALLETAIEVARQRLCEAPTRDEKMEAWREMCGLIDQRTRGLA